MTALRLGTTTWLVAPPHVTLLRPASRRTRHPTLSVLARTLGLVAATAALGFTTFASAPHAGQVQPDAAPPRALELVAPMPPAHQILVPQARADLLSGTSLGPTTGFAAASTGPAPHEFTPAAEPPRAEWREEDFATVTVADGRTLVAGGVRIQLVGIDLPMAEQVCRTLDGRLEYCRARAATQLELLTRWKRVTCHYRVERPGEAIGRCRIGTGDLSDRMVKTGYAWGAAATPG